MSGDNQMLVLVAIITIFFVGIFVGVFFEANQDTFSFIDYAPVRATLFAAFIGAYFAF